MESFPRGTGGTSTTSPKSTAPKKKRRSVDDDVLFGAKHDGSTDAKAKSSTSRPHKKSKSSPSSTTPTSAPASSTSLLPLGGGGVIQPPKGGEPWIESLSFHKLSKGMKLLAVVREIYRDVIIFSLPNLWTGFMLLSNDEKGSNKTQNMVSVGQYLSVIIVKVVQETTPEGPRRRIQVCCKPSSINPRQPDQLSSQHHPSHDKNNKAGSGLTLIRGQVKSIEDHGVVMDLGHGRRGFLNFDNIEGNYSVEEGDEVDDNEMEQDMSNQQLYNPKCPKLNVGRILDVLVRTTSSSTNSAKVMMTLMLPRTLSRQFLTSIPSLAALQPGLLVHATVEATVKNGLCVTFASGVFRGAIEVPHFGAYFLPHDDEDDENDEDGALTKKTKKYQHEESSVWKKVLGSPGLVLAARLLAVDPISKIIRLTLQPHLLDLTLPPPLPPVGSVVKDATVIRIDPGVGALLALPVDHNDSFDGGDDPDVEDDSENIKSHITTAGHDVVAAHKKSKLNADLWKKEAYQKAARVQAVYVHISKAMDDDANDTNNAKKGSSKSSSHKTHANRRGQTPDHVFAKAFAPSTQHSVRILSNGNWMDGMASGATANSVVSAYVLTHSDLLPGRLYHQVAVCATLPGGAVLIDFGMGIRAMIPPMHLFDQNTSASASSKSDFRHKLKQVMFAIGAKVDVRVLAVDAQDKKCLVTAKKSLVKASDDTIVTSYEDIRVGQTAVGFVSKLDNQGLCVTFFNNVYGRVTAKCLLEEMGMKNARENYQIGDAVTCRVVNVNKRTRRNRGRSRSMSGDGLDDKMEVDEESGKKSDSDASYWELTLSLKLRSPQAEPTTVGLEETAQLSASRLRIRAGAVLPLRSLRILELVNGKEKEQGYVPGYAVVNIKSKYLVAESEAANAPEYIDCKLPYDQLLDEYNKADIESAAALDALAAKLLQLGKKINRKGMVLADPEKASFEYATGVGKFAVVSVRPKLVELAEEQSAGEKLDVTLPSPESHVFIGGVLIGYVAQIDRRHGAFVRFLNGLTGLVPKSKGGLDLSLFSTVTTKVVSIDANTRPMKILLSVASATVTPSKPVRSGVFQPGDIVKAALVTKVDFHRVEVKILDEGRIQDYKYRARIHVTMARSKSLQQPLGKAPRSSTEQDITEWHPFSGLSVGDKLENLRIAAVDARRNTWYLDLTNVESESNADAAPLLIDSVSQLTPGQKLSGIVMSIDSRRGGLFLQISPSVTGFIPGVELSEAPDVLNDLPRHFVVGCRLECIFIDRGVWRKNHLKYEHAHVGKDAHVPYFSCLRLSETNDIAVSAPKCGQSVVGRINRSLTSFMPPSLMLELRNGYLARCCITELSELDEWTNMPLLTADTSRGKNDKSQPSSSDKSSTSGAYASGRFVTCRVLDSIPKKPLVDVSLRPSRIEGDLEDDELPEVGALAHAFVVNTTKKGCFVRLSRKVEGRVALKELCDGFLPNPPASFPPSRLVVGKIKSIRDSNKKSGSGSIFTATKLVDMDLRESVIASAEKMKLEDIQIGGKYKGTVSKLEEYGVFVKLENSDLTGLVHKSECSDNYVKSLSALYDPGDLVKVLVLKKDMDKKQLGFSMKASHFQNDPDSDDDSGSSMDGDLIEESMAVDRADDDATADDDDNMDSEDENYVSKLASQMDSNGDSDDDDESSTSGTEVNVDKDEQASSSSDGESDGNDSDSASSSSLSASAVVSGSDNRKVLDTDVGFDWGGTGALSKSTNKAIASDDEDSVCSDDEDREGDHKKSRKSRKRQAQKARQEEEIMRREIALADGTADQNPETAADFERLLAGNPNSSELWIKYMAFHLSTANIAAAKAVAERSFERISFRQEGERLNAWCAYLTLELKYGSNEEALQHAINRACQSNNPKHVYLRVCEMLEKEAEAASHSPESQERADTMFVKMCHKFKSKKSVWLAHIAYLLKTHRSDEAHARMKQALLSLPSYKHVETMNKVAQLVFEHGNPDHARTLFDGLLSKYPKRLDLFFVYVDKEVKCGDVSTARALFERQVATSSSSDASSSLNPRLKLTDKQMKSFFKKWYAFEEHNGTDALRERVKDAARAYVEQS